MFFGGGVTHHRIRRALAGTDGIETGQVFRRNRQYITFLRFVRPDRQRAHARLVVRYIAQFKLATPASVTHQLREGVGNTARAHVVNKSDGVAVAQLPAAVDHFLTAAFHFRVFALYGSKIQISIGLTRRHRRRCTTAQTDLHGRATQYDQAGTNRNLAFLHMLVADVAVTAGNHDGLVVTAYFAVVFQFEGTEVTAQVRTAEFVVEGSAAQRAIDHDVESRHDAVGLAVLAFPRLFETGDFQVGNGEAG